MLAGKFMAAMAAEGLVNEESISAQELDRVYGPLRQQVVDSCQRQEMLMARIQVSLIRPDMTEKLLTGRLSLNTNKTGEFTAFCDSKY